MSQELASFILDNLTLILLLVAIVIFSWLTIKARNVRSFQFQISIFLVVWIIGEVIGFLAGKNIIQLGISNDLSLEVHLSAMTFFCLMLWLRFYTSKRSGKKMIEDLEDSLR